MKIYLPATVRRTSSPSMTRCDGLEVRRTGKKSSATRLRTGAASAPFDALFVGWAGLKLANPK
jgi:hypothetical protein